MGSGSEEKLYNKKKSEKQFFENVCDEHLEKKYLSFFKLNFQMCCFSKGKKGGEPRNQKKSLKTSQQVQVGGSFQEREQLASTEGRGHSGRTVSQGRVGILRGNLNPSCQLAACSSGWKTKQRTKNPLAKECKIPFRAVPKHLVLRVANFIKPTGLSQIQAYRIAQGVFHIQTFQPGVVAGEKVVPRPPGPPQAAQGFLQMTDTPAFPREESTGAHTTASAQRDNF